MLLGLSGLFRAGAISLAYFLTLSSYFITFKTQVKVEMLLMALDSMS